MAVWMFLGVVSVWAQQPDEIHYFHSGGMPPGAIGQQQLRRGGPLPGYFQPVEISAPEGVKISLAKQGSFETLQNAPRKAAFLIGQVYRFKVAHIQLQPGIEIFPTIEIIDRLYPPLGQEFRFPIPVQLTENDLDDAIQGRMVTRIVYVEDPHRALPIAQEGNILLAFDVAEGNDPLKVADSLGRPVAILRIGARIPGPQGPNQRFLYGSPPWLDQFERIPPGIPQTNARQLNGIK
ncbi:MAG: hypothetical protein N2C12_17775 [Planctomycetales bacterium]